MRLHRVGQIEIGTDSVADVIAKLGVCSFPATSVTVSRECESNTVDVHISYYLPMPQFKPEERK